MIHGRWHWWTYDALKRINVLDSFQEGDVVESQAVKRETKELWADHDVLIWEMGNDVARLPVFSRALGVLEMLRSSADVVTSECDIVMVSLASSLWFLERFICFYTPSDNQSRICRHKGFACTAWNALGSKAVPNPRMVGSGGSPVCNKVKGVISVDWCICWLYTYVSTRKIVPILIGVNFRTVAILGLLFSGVVLFVCVNAGYGRLGSILWHLRSCKGISRICSRMGGTLFVE